jgi:hypothetical protein
METTVPGWRAGEAAGAGTGMHGGGAEVVRQFRQRGGAAGRPPVPVTRAGSAGGAGGAGGGPETGGGLIETVVSLLTGSST